MTSKSDLFNSIVRIASSAFILTVLEGSVLAATHEQIVERCKETARPQVVACVRGKMGGGFGNREAAIAQCRETIGRPIVVACVIREEQKQAKGAPPPAAPKDESKASPPGSGSPEPTFVPPPRTIADIAEILDREKPDAAKIAQRQAAADVLPSNNLPSNQLAQFFYDRGAARALLSRNKEALADGLQALSAGRGTLDFRQVSRIEQFVALQYRAIGDPKKAIATFDQIVRQGNQPGRRGIMINALANIAGTLVSMGDVTQAATYAGRVEGLVQEARGSPNPDWRTAYAIYGHSWEADNDSVRGLVFEAHGQYAEAEAAYRRTEAFRRAAVKDAPKYDFPPPAEQMILAADFAALWTAKSEAKQGRLSEAEADARRALLSVLAQQGKYAPATPTFVNVLSGILVEQGRHGEAERLVRVALDIQRTLGVGDDSPTSAALLSQLGNILILQHNTKEAAVAYAELERAVAKWPAEQRSAFDLNGSRIMALYAADQLDAGLSAAEQLVKRQIARTGENSFDTAAAKGVLALGYAQAQRDADAISVFKTAIPILIAAEHENSDGDDPTIVAARTARLQQVVEGYIGVVLRGTGAPSDVATDTFVLADAVRGRTVHQALVNASARTSVKDPSLAELVRKEQDLAKEINAQLGSLNNMLSLPSSERDEAGVHGLVSSIDKLRVDRNAALQEISRKFPNYSDFVDPKPATVQQIRTALKPGEALLSFYFGQNTSFAWAVPKDGAISLVALPVTALELEAKIQRLRRSLEPQVTAVEDLPAFDLDLAYQLYDLVLKPIESSWRPAKSLIVVTNGALGELPLGLLPTAPAKIDAQAKPLFAGYREVAWLARSHAVTVAPSASALATLRRLPPGSPKREAFVGYGDPYFNEQQAADAEDQTGSDKSQIAINEHTASTNITRGVGFKLRAAPRTEEIDTAELAILPRLPDTREELISIATALDVDPHTALFVGKAANERNVETNDLSHARILAFATHGLVPGDLNGLTQPALALTAPQVAGIGGTGLLTVEKILALRLDADWVVLSACNTAAGAGAGAEAASGLGRAFFYAGTRALLVTNWSVHSDSARELISDVFRRQTASSRISRSEALRQAMMALLDSGQATDIDGVTAFTYAHPIFWAPYSLIGDPGGS
jgi:CHAT domain-containing protein